MLHKREQHRSRACLWQSIPETSVGAIIALYSQGKGRTALNLTLRAAQQAEWNEMAQTDCKPFFPAWG